MYQFYPKISKINEKINVKVSTRISIRTIERQIHLSTLTSAQESKFQNSSKF